MENRVLEYVITNKAITKIDEILARIPDVNKNELTQEVYEALENNKTEMKLMLKTKLFKNNTTQALLELNRIIDNETNNKKIGNLIDKISEKWKSDELQ